MKLSFLDVLALGQILILLLMLVPQRHWFVEMFCNFLHWALLPSIPILIVLIAMRRWQSAALWSVPALTFLILFGGLFLPNFDSKHICDSETDETCRHLRVMTFNLSGTPIGDRSGQIEMLRNSGADIIALQEVNQEVIDEIEVQLSDIYPYRVLIPERKSGSGMLSKYPIESHEFFRIESSGHYHTKAIVEIDGLPITVFSSHPPPPKIDDHIQPRSQRFTQLNAIVEMALQGGPVLLMGDFNLTDQSMYYGLFTNAGLKDSWREVGWGFGPTWPARVHASKQDIPVIRIDYIWHTDEFQAISARTGERTTSDHLPVIADLAIVSSE